MGKKKGTGSFIISILLLIFGIGLMITALDLSKLPLLSTIGISSPVGSITIEDISEESAKKIGVGAIITFIGIVLLIKGK